jgi:hypothetical protein
MIIHKNNLPEDFYNESWFPIGNYIYHKWEYEYSVWSYCDSPIWKWEIIWILDNGVEIITLNWKTDKIHISFIKILSWIINQNGSDKKWYNGIIKENVLVISE